MHTVLLLSTLAWLCYLGAWLLLDFSLGQHLQVLLDSGLFSQTHISCHVDMKAFLALHLALPEQYHAGPAALMPRTVQCVDTLHGQVLAGGERAAAKVTTLRPLA